MTRELKFHLISQRSITFYICNLTLFLDLNNRYYEQLMRILPDELAERIQVSMRLQAIATDTLGLGE